MKVAFYSNFINHHQIPLCEAFISNVGKDNFYFIATMPVPEERIQMGYPSDNNAYPYVITTYDNDEKMKYAKDLALRCDIVIIGSAPDSFIVKRLNKGLITFRYSERFFRFGWNIKTIPRYFLSSVIHHKRFEDKPLFCLCSSAYTSGDINRFANYKNKTYKWGYFPKVKKYTIVDLLNNKSKKNCILWVGRLLKLKHPEAAIEVAIKLKNDNYDFSLTIIGDGEQKKYLETMIDENNLQKYVKILGSKSNEEVRKYMEKSDIFLFTSDFQEGWGAVLNESMNSACAVVASHAIGSVPFLIKHNHNGLIYKNGSIDDLYNKVKYLIDNPKKCMEFGENAYYTLLSLWNADIAAKRLIKLYEGIKNNHYTIYDEGPCSIAENILEEFMFQKLKGNALDE